MEEKRQKKWENGAKNKVGKRGRKNNERKKKGEKGKTDEKEKEKGISFLLHAIVE